MDNTEKVLEQIESNLLSAYQQMGTMLTRAAENSRALLDLSIMIRNLEESREKLKKELIGFEGDRNE